jgi:hypothetical protein
MGVFFFPTERDATVGLYGLGDRCLHEPASRRLDGEIYCTVHNVTDWNPLISNELLRARENGEVLVEQSDGLAWIEVPAFTAELKVAESLLPDGLLTFFRDVRRVCATALQARALANDLPPMVSTSLSGEVASSWLKSNPSLETMPRPASRLYRSKLARHRGDHSNVFAFSRSSDGA